MKVKIKKDKHLTLSDKHIAELKELENKVNEHLALHLNKHFNSEYPDKSTVAIRNYGISPFDKPTGQYDSVYKDKRSKNPIGITINQENLDKTIDDLKRMLPRHFNHEALSHVIDRIPDNHADWDKILPLFHEELKHKEQLHDDYIGSIGKFLTGGKSRKDLIKVLDDAPKSISKRDSRYIPLLASLRMFPEGNDMPGTLKRYHESILPMEETNNIIRGLRGTPEKHLRMPNELTYSYPYSYYNPYLANGVDNRKHFFRHIDYFDSAGKPNNTAKTLLRGLFKYHPSLGINDGGNPYQRLQELLGGHFHNYFGTTPLKDTIIDSDILNPTKTQSLRLCISGNTSLWFDKIYNK